MRSRERNRRGHGTSPQVTGLALLGAVALPGCSQKATEVIVSVYTDVPCEATAAVAAGKPGELGSRPASAVSTECDSETGYLGSAVVVPQGSDSKEIAVEVRVRADGAPPDSCLADNGYRGCIVARRILHFIPHRSVQMRIDLRNPCLDVPCSETTTCVAQGFSGACIDATIDLSNCVDGDCGDSTLLSQSQTPFEPCAPETNPCDAIATCRVMNQAVTCLCPDGYENDSKNAAHCVDIDECEQGLDECSAYADCTNDDGGYSCACREGYTGNGRSCAPTGCEPCAEHASCVGDPDGKACLCDAGYDGDALASGSGCANVDECALQQDDCVAGASCADTEGAFTCSCPVGYSGDGRGSGNGCTDIDECAAGTWSCALGTHCVNREPGYGCEPDFCATLSALWTGDSGTELTDLVGGLPGTLAGNAVAGAEGFVGGGFDLDSGTFTIESAPAISVGTADFTIAFWMRLPSATAGDTAIFDKRAGSTSPGYHMTMYDVSQPLLQLNDGSTWYNYFPPPGEALDDGDWHLIVASVARATVGGVNLYVDGTLVSKGNSLYVPGSLDASSPWILGSFAADNRFGLDELQLYKAALTDVDVQLMLQAGSAGICRATP